MTSTIDQEVGARIREARIRAGVSQMILAVRAGISLQTLRLAERAGLATPRTLSRISRALPVSYDLLVGHQASSCDEHLRRKLDRGEG